MGREFSIAIVLRFSVILFGTPAPKEKSFPLPTGMTARHMLWAFPAAELNITSSFFPIMLPQEVF
jgi:hypothetical protein